MSRRLFMFLVALFCTLGVLLLLSALIVSPTAEDAAPVQPPAAHSVTALYSMPAAPAFESMSSISAWLRIAALFAIVTVHIPRLNCTCDANGRVLCSRRYVRSFYPVFKQDLACG